MSSNVRNFPVRVKVFTEKGEVHYSDIVHLFDSYIEVDCLDGESTYTFDEFEEYMKPLGSLFLIDTWKYVWGPDVFCGHTPIPFHRFLGEMGLPIMSAEQTDDEDPPPTYESVESEGAASEADESVPPAEELESSDELPEPHGSKSSDEDTPMIPAYDYEGHRMENAFRQAVPGVGMVTFSRLPRSRPQSCASGSSRDRGSRRGYDTSSIPYDPAFSRHRGYAWEDLGEG
jgi:hypothetical protein